MGEVGRRLTEALRRSGAVVRSVTREHGWQPALDPRDPSPRLVAVREEQLGAVLERFPSEMRPRLVLVQNGFLEAVYGDVGEAARGLIYFTAKGGFFRVLCPSIFHGPGIEPLVRALDAGGIPSRFEGSTGPFLEEMIVKGIWNSVVGLPLAVHDVDLATYLERHRPELDALAVEGVRAAGAEYRVSVEPARAVRVIIETTGELGGLRGGIKALAFRNGAIARFGRRHGVPTPVNDRLLAAVGVKS